MAQRTAYWDITNNQWIRSATDPSGIARDAALPFIKYREKLLLDLELKTVVSNTVDNFTGWSTGGPYTFSFAIDNDWTHFYSGTLAAALTGAITVIKISDLSTTPLATGNIVLENSGGESESVPYTAVVANGDDWWFTVSATLTYSYAQGDTAKYVEPVLVEASNAEIDSSDVSTGKFRITLDASTRSLLNAIEGSQNVSGARWELLVYDGSGDIVDSVGGTFEVLNILHDIASLPPPAPVSNYYNKSQSDARYLVKPGLAGGQTAAGGTAAGENITLTSTEDATKGYIIFGSTSGLVYDEENNKFISKINQSYTDTNYTVARSVTDDINFIAAPSSPITQTTDFHGLDISHYTLAGNNGAFLMGIYPLESTAGFQGTTGTTLDRAVGFYGQARHDGAGGVLTLAIGVQGRVQNKDIGEITDAASLYALNGVNDGGGTVTNYHGLLVPDITAGTNNWAIKTNAGAVQFGDNVTIVDNKKLGVGTSPSFTCHVYDDAAVQAQFHGYFSGGANTNHGSIRIGASTGLCGLLEYDANNGYYIVKNTWVNANARVTLTANSLDLVFNGSGNLSAPGAGFFGGATAIGTEKLGVTGNAYIAGDVYLNDIFPTTTTLEVLTKQVNGDTNIHVIGNGTGRGFIRLYDQDDSEYLRAYSSSGAGYIDVGGTSPGALNLNSLADSNITCFISSTSGETKELQIYGYRTADSLRSLQIGVGIDAADTASFDGVSNYLFDGTVKASKLFLNNATAVGSEVFGVIGSIYASGDITTAGKLFAEQSINVNTAISSGKVTIELGGDFDDGIVIVNSANPVAFLGDDDDGDGCMKLYNSSNVLTTSLYTDGTQNEIYGDLNVDGVVYDDGIYGEIFLHDGATAQSIPTGATYTKVTGFTTDGSSSNVTNDVANDKLTVTKAGTYKATISCSFISGTANVIWTAALFVNGVEATNVHFNRKTTVAGDVGCASGCGIVSISANDDVDMRIQHNNGGSVNFTPVDLNLNLEYVGI